MAGPERSYLYLVAGVTGLRRSELQRLIWSDLELAGNHPAVILDGTRTKNNQDAYQPLPVTVAGQLAKWKQSRGALDSDKVFPHMTEHCRAGEMIQSDLVVMLKAEQDQLSSGRRKEIERPVCDDAGRKIDFHSLRVSYITWLADSNIPAKTVQKLARHSTLALTFGVYAKPVLSTEHLAVASLPEVIDEQQPTAAVG
jgi:integrase